MNVHGADADDISTVLWMGLLLLDLKFFDEKICIS